jgi:hypothetical protein
VLANIMSESSHCFRKLRMQIVYNDLPSFWADYYMLIYTHCWELMNSMGSHGSSSPPFMKVMVCHFVSDSHEVMTALIVLFFNCCCGDFSATSSSLLHTLTMKNLGIWRLFSLH